MLKTHLRVLEKDDYHKNYLQLLEQLTVVHPEKISYTFFAQFVSNLTDTHTVYIIEDTANGKIIASGTIFIEPKLIHAGGNVGHLEDIVVDKEYRNQHIGKTMVNALVDYAHKRGCYKVILDCAEKNVGFYEKCALASKGYLMSHYLE